MKGRTAAMAAAAGFEAALRGKPRENRTHRDTEDAFFVGFDWCDEYSSRELAGLLGRLIDRRHEAIENRLDAIEMRPSRAISDR